MSREPTQTMQCWEPNDSASRLTRRLIGSLVLALSGAGIAGGAWLSGVL